MNLYSLQALRGGGRGGFAGHSNVRISVDTKTSRIIAFGRTTDHETIKATIKELESTE